MGFLAQCQALIGQCYELNIPFKIDEFLVTEKSRLGTLLDTQLARKVDETVFIYQHEQGLDVSVYIDRDVLQALEHSNPLRKLNETNLQQFLTALEGVSHFMCLLWRAMHERPVSLFELELQAEVDKYVLCLLLLHRQQQLQLETYLHDRLFNHFRYADSLDEQELLRYRSANHYASRYCENLIRSFRNRMDVSSYWRELRRFYRLGQSKKLMHIEHCPQIP